MILPVRLRTSDTTRLSTESRSVGRAPAKLSSAKDCGGNRHQKRFLSRVVTHQHRRIAPAAIEPEIVTFCGKVDQVLRTQDLDDDRQPKTSEMLGAAQDYSNPWPLLRSI